MIWKLEIILSSIPLRQNDSLVWNRWAKNKLYFSSNATEGVGQIAISLGINNLIINIVREEFEQKLQAGRIISSGITTLTIYDISLKRYTNSMATWEITFKCKLNISHFIWFCQADKRCPRLMNSVQTMLSLNKQVIL